MHFKPATRQGVKPLIGLYAESGCGKTLSALYLARGIAGPNGRVGMIDTESGRGSLYADVIPGGYDVMELNAPFSPQNYVEAIESAEKAGVDVLVIDSMSHEWEGTGGVLDQAGDSEQKSGRPGLHNWKNPKLEHNRLVLKLLQSRLIIICCIRAKYKSRQIREPGKKSEIVKDDHVSPIQSEEFIFEMTAHAEILPNHTIHLTKCSHPALRECFPKDNTDKLSIAHGEAIAKWASAPGPISRPQTQSVDPEIADLKRRLNDRAKGHFSKGGKLDVEALTTFLIENGVMNEGETLSTIPADRLKAIVHAVEDTLEAKF